jgi:hypothetical protein
LNKLGDLTFEIGNEYYIANVQPIKSSRGDVLLVSAPATGFKAATDELSLFRQRIEESEPVVAYVFIDNLSELAQNEGESFRPAATKIDEFLREWATDVNGIIKEFERDRYLLIFEKRFLDRYKDLLEFMIPYYVREGKCMLNIGVGCTGGRHRSVFIAQRIGTILEQLGYKTIVHHRDIDRDPRYEIKKPTAE